ncbi:MAG: restriction endonuclease subunit S [Bacteroidota bacterium]
MKEWTTIKLGKLITESKIESKKPNTKNRIRVKLNLGGVEKRPDSKDKEGATKYYIRQAGQFIYGSQNLHKGAFGIVPTELNGYESSADIPAFDVHESCFPEWIFYFFKQGNFYLKLEPLAKGVGSKRIHPKQLFELNIPLPPKEEQKKILDSINDFECKFSEATKEFKNQQNLIDKLRKTILQDAFHGVHSETWRSEHLNEETANELLKKIQKEKLELIVEKKIPKEKFLPKIKATSLPFEIPNSWCWCRYGDLILDVEAGKSPFCEPQKAQADQWGVIKISAVSWGKFLGDENKTLPLTIPPFTEKEIKSGDFILSRANTAELIAKSVIVPENVRSQLLLNDKTLRVKFSEFIELKYINYYNNGPIARAYYLTVASGTSDSMKNISRENIKSQLIPLPPLEEQKEIANKIEQLLLNCLQLEKQIEQSKNDSEILFQTELSKYFPNTNTELNAKISNKNKQTISILPLRLMNSYTLKNHKSTMELEQLLEQNGKMSAISLWRMSKFYNNIDGFYEELKKLVEEKNVIKESKEKGYLELVK